MRHPKETELIDYALGGSTAEEAAKLQQAAQEDPRVAAQIKEWSDLVSISPRERHLFGQRVERIVQSVQMKLMRDADCVGHHAGNAAQRKTRSLFQRLNFLYSAGVATLLCLGFGIVALVGTYRQEPTKTALMPLGYVAFSHAGQIQGTSDKPFCMLSQGLRGVAPGGVLVIRQGHSQEAIRITKPMRLRALDGPVIIGGYAPAQSLGGKEMKKS